MKVYYCNEDDPCPPYLPGCHADGGCDFLGVKVSVIRCDFPASVVMRWFGIVTPSLVVTATDRTTAFHHRIIAYRCPAVVIGRFPKA